MQAYYRIFKSLIAYIKQHYQMGLTWNQKSGIDAKDALAQVKAGSSSTTAGGPPPPPPPPPLPTFENAPPPPPMPSINGSAKSPPSDMGAVFEQLSKGEAVTAGLRKVDKSQMTHKNPALRTNNSVPERSASQSSVTSDGRGKSPAPARRPKPESMRTKKPPKKTLEGNKWFVENYDNMGSEIVEINAELNHSILITKCTKTIIKITGKANAISIDNSPGLSLIIDSLVSAVDVIKSNKFALQINDSLPTVMLDQVDGAQIYLSKSNTGTEVFTSKCAAVNLIVPGDDDDTEAALPEQIKSVVRNGKVYNEIVEHAG